jgi:ferric-dicitrate binding protein FerR (iron transport regulator)
MPHCRACRQAHAALVCQAGDQGQAQVQLVTRREARVHRPRDRSGVRRRGDATVSVAFNRASRSLGSRRESFAVKYKQNSSIGLRLPAGLVAFFAVCLFAGLGQAQSGACRLQPDKYNPSEQVLRCGDELTITPAPGTAYHPVDTAPGHLPSSVRLDSGALFVKFHPAARPGNFQILTPQAIASVRGTTWAVEAKDGRTSVLVLTGVVDVTSANAATTAVVREGQGVDVDSQGGPLQVKRWSSARKRALLARFGR